MTSVVYTVAHDVVAPIVAPYHMVAMVDVAEIVAAVIVATCVVVPIVPVSNVAVDIRCTPLQSSGQALHNAESPAGLRV